MDATYVKIKLLSSAKHIVAMSRWKDTESKALFESYGAITLIVKANLIGELLPTLLELSLSSLARMHESKRRPSSPIM